MRDEVAWTELDTEWREIIARQRTSPATDASDWESAMEMLVAEQEGMVRDGRWVGGPDDLLSIIGRAHIEAYHSTILAWLLDPHGRHGLGTSLLEAFLQKCGDVPADLHGARPACEVQREETRADVVVSGPGFTLIIENKIYAPEQDRQCDRLFERFGEDPGACFLFLTPTGRAPQTATGAARSAFARMSYPELAAVLRELLVRGTGTKHTKQGRETVSNYLSTLVRMFQ